MVQLSGFHYPYYHSSVFWGTYPGVGAFCILNKKYAVTRKSIRQRISSAHVPMQSGGYFCKSLYMCVCVWLFTMEGKEKNWMFPTQNTHFVNLESSSPIDGSFLGRELSHSCFVSLSLLVWLCCVELRTYFRFMQCILSRCQVASVFLRVRMYQSVCHVFSIHLMF